MTENKVGYYLAPILKIGLFIFFLLVCSVPLLLITQLNFLPIIFIPLFSDIVLQIGLCLVVLGALLMIFKVQPNLSFFEIFVRKTSAFSQFLKGCAAGCALMLLCTALIYVGGNVTFAFVKISWASIALYLVYFLAIAAFEELLFRTYTLHVLAARYSIGLAAFLNGLLFAFAHLANQHITLIGVINITLAGMLFAFYTLQRQQVLWAVGVHFTWNFTQSVILGYNVSGNRFAGLLTATPKGATYISGGNFGIEGSIWCTLLLLASLLWCFLKSHRNSVALRS